MRFLKLKKTYFWIKLFSAFWSCQIILLFVLQINQSYDLLIHPNISWEKIFFQRKVLNFFPKNIDPYPRWKHSCCLNDYFQTRVRFNKTYKNPCWYDNSGKLLCLPYFMIIGMPKCGTTDMFYSIIRHPEVKPPIRKDGGVKKELHFFTTRHYGRLKFLSLHQ